LNVSLEQMQKINKVQIGILRQIVNVCQTLGIRFFAVHGTLLGTLRNQGFVPFDDDIDIAMHRADYERFLTEAPKLLEEGYFVQSAATDPDYPLSFAKVRDNRTAYVVENVQHLAMNHGIYVDIFPVDFVQTGKWNRLLNKYLSFRISTVYRNDAKSLMGKCKRFVGRLPVISVRKAVLLKDRLAKKVPRGEYVCMTGGKGIEKRMPAAWFEDYTEACFEGVQVWMPKEYDKYLTHIYGDYKNRTLVEGKMADETHVMINACIVDPEKPYTEYVKRS